MMDSSRVLQAETLIERVRSSWITRHRPQSQSTDWGQSLAMYGLIRSLKAHYDAATHEYLRTWLHFHLSEGVHPNYFCGSWSIGILIPEAIEWFPEVRDQLERLAREIYEFILHTAVRNGDGVLLHNIDLPNIYIDTVYYSALPLARCALVVGEDWRDEALYQIDRHLEILELPQTPFYIHCEDNRTGHRSEGAWARGNGWVMMTSAELLDALPDAGEFRTRIAALSNALTSLQSPTGLWRTILDDAFAYDEASASAMYLYALLRMQRGTSEVTMRAFDALAKCVDEEGRFIQVSEGTWPGTIEYYKSLSTGEWWWGTGAYLLALSEMVIASKKH